MELKTKPTFQDIFDVAPKISLFQTDNPSVEQLLVGRCITALLFSYVDLELRCCKGFSHIDTVAQDTPYSSDLSTSSENNGLTY